MLRLTIKTCRLCSRIRDLEDEWTESHNWSHIYIWIFGKQNWHCKKCITISTFSSLGSDSIKDQLLGKDSAWSKSQQISPGLLIPPPGITTPPLPHFVCDGCGIKFKSVSNLQAHQSRYCASLRKASEDAFEAMLLKQKQQQHSAVMAAAAQQQQEQQKANAAASMPMLEMMSLLNAKSNIEQNDKLSSLMMSTMAAAAMQAAAANNNSPGSTNTQSNGSSSNTNSDDYCCILCGYKEQSVERLKVRLLSNTYLHYIFHVLWFKICVL